MPREYVTGETIDSALELLRRSDLAAQLEPCRDFAQAVGLAERLQLAPVPGDDRACQGNAARCALELALLDAYGRRFGEPLSAVTRLAAQDLYQARPWVRYSGGITSASGRFKVGFAALRMRVYGFRQVKVKVGIAGHDDVQRLRSDPQPRGQVHGPSGGCQRGLAARGGGPAHPRIDSVCHHLRRAAGASCRGGAAGRESGAR